MREEEKLRMPTYIGVCSWAKVPEFEGAFEPK